MSNNLLILIGLALVVLTLYAFNNNNSIELFQSDLSAYNLISETSPLTATRRGDRYIRKYIGSDLSVGYPNSYYFDYGYPSYGWPYYNRDYNLPYYGWSV